MLTLRQQEKELIILKTLNGPITLNITKSISGKLNLSIKAPEDVKIYREDLTVFGESG